MNSEGFELLQGSRLSAPQRMKGNLLLEGIQHNQECINTKKNKLACGNCYSISLKLFCWNLLKVRELAIVFLSHFLGAICKPKCCDCIVIVFLMTWLKNSCYISCSKCGQCLHTEVWLTVWLRFHPFSDYLERNLIDLNIRSQTTVYDYGQLAGS